MRFMHWSYDDLCELPSFYLDVLIDMVQEEAQDAAHQRVLAEARAHARR